MGNSVDSVPDHLKNASLEDIVTGPYSHLGTGILQQMYSGPFSSVAGAILEARGIGPIESNFTLVNATSRELTIKISSVDGFDFVDSHRPDRQFDGRFIDSGSRLRQPIRMTGYANGNPFNLALNFSGGTCLLVRVNLRFVDKNQAGNEEPKVTGGDTALYNMEWEVNGLDMTVTISNK